MISNLQKRLRIPILGPIRGMDLAFSGGQDSSAALEFILRGKHRPRILHFRHGTNHSIQAFEFVSDYCHTHELELISERIQGSKPKDQSWEEWWRNERYKFFRQHDNQIMTVHHLDDVAETWLMGAIHGRPRLIPYRNRNVVRPFLLTPKTSLSCDNFIQDPSNDKLEYDRNKIRTIMNTVKSVNPGYLTVIAKKIREEYERESKSPPGEVSG